MNEGAVCEMFKCRFRLSIFRTEILGPNKCVPGGIRTPNLLIRSQKLYPVELQALRQ
jgi:hypothetical protein